MPRQIFLLVACLLSLNCYQAFAKPIEFIRDYTYEAGEADSKLSCRTIALEQTKRLLLEELGTYLVSNTIVKDSQLTKDEIVTYTAGSVITIVIEERWDGKIYFLKAKIKADADDVAKSINSIRHDEERASELEELRKKANESFKEIERLKQQLAAVHKTDAPDTSASKSIDIKSAYQEKIQELSAKDLLEQGIAYRQKNQFELSLEALNRANQLVPNWGRIYLARGRTLHKLGRIKLALADYEKALKFEPNNMVALSYHGTALYHTGKKSQGLSEIELALKKAPQYDAVVANMGWVCLQQDQPEKALEYLTTALDLQKVKSGRTVFLRAIAFRRLNRLDESIKEMKWAARLGDPSALKMLSKNKTGEALQE